VCYALTAVEYDVFALGDSVKGFVGKSSGRCLSVRNIGLWLVWHENETGLLMTALQRFADADRGRYGHRLSHERAQWQRPASLGDGGFFRS
jgi:hypothetical protein